MGIHLEVPVVTGTNYTAFFDDVQIVPGPVPAAQTPTLSLNYGYDGFGNLTSKGATNGQYSTTLIVEGKTNRVVSAGGVTFTYTANGSAQPSGTSTDTFNVRHAQSVDAHQ